MADQLSHGADVEMKDETERTALSWAAGNGHAATVTCLLTAGAESIEAEDARGRSALSWAAGNGHVASMLVLVLVEHGADLESRDAGGRTALKLMWATSGGNAAVRPWCGSCWRGMPIQRPKMFRAGRHWHGQLRMDMPQWRSGAVAV
jgi:ankyrin repeat protein